MTALQSIDDGLFHFLNQQVANPVFDVLMPFLSANRFFIPAVLGLVVFLLWRGAAKGRIYVLLIAILLGLGDPLLCNSLKNYFQRPRPFVTHADARRPGKDKMSAPAAAAPAPAAIPAKARRTSYSMPSAHAFNWGALAMITFIFYRRTWRYLVPLALAVAYSRVYNGVHYPSDVLAGLLLGATYGFAGVITLNTLWGSLGRKLFPLWHARLPNLAAPKLEPAPTASPASRDQQWLRLASLVIVLVFIARLIYLASGIIQLSEDEAYQWLWSKHLALSYYSKPFGIALAQWLGTQLCGDTALGVRFLAPVLAALLNLLLARFLTRHADGRTAFLFVLICLATPLIAGGSIVMMIDILLVFFWTLTLLTAWRAITQDSTAWWIATGLCLGAAFLCKYISPFQWASFALFFLLCKSARPQLRRPGPWLALGINLLATLPVILWNAHHDWITLTHLGERGGLNQPWHPTLKFFFEFIGGQLALLNPVFAFAGLWAIVAFFKNDFKKRAPASARMTLELFLLCQGIVVFAFYTLYTLHSRVQLNWAAAGAMPLLLFATLWWQRRWQAGDRKPAWFISLGLGLGLPFLVFAHNTDLVEKVFGRALPGRIDPLHRLRGHDQAARIVGAQRARLLQEGQPVFIIADHYGRASLLSFYLPEARPLVQGDALVTLHKTDKPRNQIWFWPGYDYTHRTGQNAIFVRETDNHLPAPDWLVAEFASVTDLGMFDIEYLGRNYNRLQLFQCRGKK